MKISQVKSVVKQTIRENFKQSVLEGKGIPKFFLKMGAVKKEIDRLTAERKSKFGGEYARKLNAETDPKKREQLKQPILAISQKISKLQANLAGMYEQEEEYIKNLDKDTELDLAESVNESFVKGKTYGGTKCEGGCYVGKQGLVKIIKISKDNPNNTFIFRQDNFSGLQPHFIKNGVIGKATTLNPSYDLDRNKVRNLKITNDIILSIQLFD
jgi:hypothetical protein